MAAPARRFGDRDPGMLPSTNVDREIDAASPNPGRQGLEKKVAGFYLGEIARRCLCRLVDAGELWSGPGAVVPPALQGEPYSFESRFVSEIEFDMSER